MITGIAALGVLAGSLASFFRLDNGTPANGSPTADQPASTATAHGDAALQSLTAEVSALRHQVQALTARLTGILPGPARQEPTADEDTPGWREPPRASRSSGEHGLRRRAVRRAVTCSPIA